MDEGTTGAMFYDVNRLDSLSTDLGAKATEFSELIENMYSLIEGMNGVAWSGKSYDAFLNMCNTFRTGKINPIISKIKGWSSGVNTISENASANTAANEKQFEEVI